jgi:hypothetical protein
MYRGGTWNETASAVQGGHQGNGNSESDCQILLWRNVNPSLQICRGDYHADLNQHRREARIAAALGKRGYQSRVRPSRRVGVAGQVRAINE